MLESNTSLMDANKKSNKIREIVRLQQILKKWKKLANASPSSSKNNISNTDAITTSTGGGGSSNSGSKGIKFLKRTLSFSSDSSSYSASAVPKGYLALCVGKELKRFIIPTGHLVHPAFVKLLQQAEEEFGLQQQGVLKIPCEVPIFENILKQVEDKQPVFFLEHDDDHLFNAGTVCPPTSSSSSSSSDCELTPSHQIQLCR